MAVLLVGEIAVLRPAAGQLQVTTEPSPVVVSSTSYQARVESDGCLTSLRVGDREFLAAGASISRGAYLFRGGVLALRDLRQPDASTVVARGDQAEVRYQFGESGATITVRNDADQDTAFFLVLSSDVAGVLIAGLPPQQPAMNQRVADADFAIGDAKLSVRGLDRLWGPWQGPHQVCEVMLRGGDERTIELTAGRLTPDERAAVVALLRPADSPPLAVNSPREYQVTQRSSLAAGRCRVSGRLIVDADAVEYRITGDSQFGDLPGEWQAAELTPTLKTFHAEIDLPAGGWYGLEVRALQGKHVVAEHRVKHFGIGEVFVGAGQSNSTNCGETPTKQMSGMVASFSGDQWKLADDPQGGVADRSTGGSFWPALGDAMHKRYGVPIGVAATGFGGTSVTQWQPEGDLFKWMMTRVHQLGPQGFRALLWHQGESDVDMPGDEYYLKLERVIAASRDEAGWPIPWFVAQATYHNKQRPYAAAIRRAQARLWHAGVALRGPDTDLLQEEFRDLGGKGIHFSPKGLKRHGEMWAECVAPLIDLQLGLVASADALALPAAEQWPEADALFRRDPDWLGGDDAYSIDLGGGRVAWFFGDSFVEPSTPGERRGTTMVRNSIGIQRGYDPVTADFTAYWRRNGDRPSSLIAEDGDDFYWPGGGVVLDDALLLFLMRAQNADAALNFRTTGWGAILAENLDLPPDQWHITKLDVPQNQFDVLVGSGSVLAAGDFVYAYSHSAQGIVLLRWDRDAAAQGDLSKPQWYDAQHGSWTPQNKVTALPTPLFAPGQTEFTVHRQQKHRRYLQVQFMGFPQTPVGYRTAPELTGPWSALQPLFMPEEMYALDEQIMLYAGKLHPEQHCEGTALTYASNAFSLKRIVDDNSLYYPRFARVRLPSETE